MAEGPSHPPMPTGSRGIMSCAICHGDVQRVEPQRGLPFWRHKPYRTGTLARARYLKEGSSR